MCTHRTCNFFFFLQVEAVLLFNVSLTSIEECDFDVILSSYLLSGALLFQNILFMILGLSKTEWFVPCFSSLAILFNFLIFFLLALPAALMAWRSDDDCDKTYPLFLAYFGLCESVATSMFYLLWYGRTPFSEIKREDEWRIQLLWCKEVKERGKPPRFENWVCFRTSAQPTHLELKRVCRKRQRVPVARESQVQVIPGPQQNPELVRQNEELIRMVRGLEEQLRGIQINIQDREEEQQMIVQPPLVERRFERIILRRAGVDAFNYMRNVCSICTENIERNDEVIEVIGCGHLYHRDELEQWLLRGRLTCPNCGGVNIVTQEELRQLREMADH